MGLFSFIKEAGKKIFKSKDEETTANPSVSTEQVTTNQKSAMDTFIQKHGLNIENYELKFLGGGKVSLHGNASTKADYEKAALIAGNIVGIDEVDNQITIGAEAEAVDSQLHTVEKGDTLWAIATSFYNDGTKYPIIVEANQPMIKDADEIYPGQVLRIPALGE